MLKLAMLTTVAVVAMAGLAWSAEPPKIQTPKVLTDDAVDSTTIEGIVESLFKSPDKAKWTDEQKVINFYHWYRRVVYPYRYMAADRRDVLKQINTGGCSLCGSQAAVCSVILRAAGYETRALAANVGPEWGHTFWEVKYDGGWHLFDAMSAFYVMTRDNPPHVASGDEIEADPTLVTKAIAEKRVGPEFLYTMRKHEISLEQRAEFAKETGGADVAWSLLVTKPGSLLDFWTAAAERKKIKVISNDTNGGRYTPGVLDVTLKANERYVRMWHGEGKWLTRASFAKYPYANMAAGDNEAFDTINFKYFEPYRQPSPNPYNKAVYRTYGNGYLEWQPATAAQLAQGAALSNCKFAGDGAAVTVEDAAKPAELALAIKSPYGVVEIAADVELKQLGEGATAQAVLVGEDGKRAIWKSEKLAAGKQQVIVPLHDQGSPLYVGTLKIVLTKAAGATVTLGRLRTTFQCNPMTLPHLTGGKNTVRVSAAGETKLSGGKLRVTYRWFDAPAWTQAKSDTHELTELPASYEITLPTNEAGKLPKMESLELMLQAD